MEIIYGISFQSVDNCIKLLIPNEIKQYMITNNFLETPFSLKYKIPSTKTNEKQIHCIIMTNETESYILIKIFNIKI